MKILVISLLSLTSISIAVAGDCKSSTTKNLYEANIVKCKGDNTKWLITNMKYLNKGNTRLPASLDSIPERNDELRWHISNKIYMKR